MSDATRNRRARRDRTRATLVAIICGLTAASAAYRLLRAGGLEHTSLVFIGIPAVLALAVVFSDRKEPRTAVGTVFRAITIALLLSGIVFGEAFVCILFASPLFYMVGGTVATIYQYFGRKGRDEAQRALDRQRAGLLAIALVPMSLEGVAPGFALGREERVAATRVVAASAADVGAALAEAPHFDRELPAFLQLGFPTPGMTAGTGLRVGDRRTVQLEHGEHHPGALVMEVTRSEPGLLEFRAVSDDSYVTHWLAWRGAEVRWEEASPGRTRVRWTLAYRRRLDPAWYFAPLERHAVGLAAGYLIETLATPR
ncbi:MAG TPA: hypothetical protein VKA84_04605 [Gemmatimonadaceae bacterium]|nr:hypothetical protein [Gemmatimonadaceae bacterium]